MNPATLLILLSGLCCTIGCQSLLNRSILEQRVVDQFAEAVREENEPALRRITSGRFEDKALRSEDVLRDLRVLKLPTGEVSVVEVEEIDEDHRQVIVKEESGGKYQFHLIRDPKKKLWVVDDIVVRQRSKGTQVTRSTAEVMDLLVSLREFLKVWETGSRDQILALTTNDLQASLEPLPEEWLQALTHRIASTYEDGMARKPEANMGEGEAVVKLPSKNGHLMLKIVRVDNQWLVDDVESHNHRTSNHAGSVRRQADAMNTVNAFLTAYATEDDPSLRRFTTPKFHSSSLEFADLSLVHLPKAVDVPAEFDLRAYENLLTFMLPAGNEIVRLDLEEQVSELPEIVDNQFVSRHGAGPRFLVRDVTLYEKGTDRQRSLSAVFTAPTRASLFLKALQDLDHEILSQISTTELAQGTWQRATPEIMASLPIPDFYDPSLTLVSSHSMGPRTELEFSTDNGLDLSCTLVNQNGLLKIDDIQFPNAMGQVTSLKSRLELAVPILEFSAAWSANDMELLQKSCSSDFNRLVWSHLSGVPGQFDGLSHKLQAPMLETRVTQERATVRLGDGTGIPISARLILEHGFWVVDEVQLDMGSGKVVAVRETLRSQIASKMLSGSYSTVYRDDGHQVVVPVQPTSEGVDMSPASETEAASVADFDAWAGSGVQSDAVRTSPDSGRVQQASASMSDSINRGAVDHAIYHQYPDDEPQKLKQGRVRPAVSTREITESSPSSATPPARLASDSNMLFFGPDQDILAETNQTPETDSTDRSASMTHQKIRQPADAPIEIE